MSGVRTISEFSSALDGDKTWRIREISDIKSAILRADPVSQRALLRALVPICYAHWEGFVKSASYSYMSYIVKRRSKYKELSHSFVISIYMSEIKRDLVSFNFREKCSSLEKILTKNDERLSRFDSSIISTKSNLSLDVLLDICFVCGVDKVYFEDRRLFINEKLLSRRNEIAHGQHVGIDLSELDDLVSGTLELIRAFGNEIENNLVKEIYKRKP